MKNSHNSVAQLYEAIRVLEHLLIFWIVLELHIDEAISRYLPFDNTNSFGNKCFHKLLTIFYLL